MIRTATAGYSSSQMKPLPRLRSIEILSCSPHQKCPLSLFVIALVAVGGLAAALSTASGLLLVISSVITHDLYYRIINSAATESQRLVVGRLMIGFAIVVAGYFDVNPPGFVAEVVAIAFGLAAASFFPVLGLGIFDQRANKEGAITGMTSGLLFTLCYIVGVKFLNMSPWFFGVSAEGIGTVGVAINFAMTLIVSRLTPPPPAEIQAMIAEIRDPFEPTIIGDSEEVYQRSKVYALLLVRSVV